MGKRRASSEPPSSDPAGKRPRRDTRALHENPTRLSNQLDSESTSESDNITEICAEEITVAIFCALPYEAVAVRYSLDEEYTCHPRSIGPPKYVYSYGRIKHHKVVIARPHYMGTVQAGHCASAVRQQFVNVQFALAVGTGTAVPNTSSRDIRLGDVAVGLPRDNHPGIIQFDFGKYEQGAFRLKGCLNKPPAILISADGSLEEDEEMGSSRLGRFLRHITRNSQYGWPKMCDVPLEQHLIGIGKATICRESAPTCDKELLLAQEFRMPVVHRGLILSGNGIVNNIRDSDIFHRGYKDALCFETESAGIMDELPCLAIRGICSYADTRGRSGWERHAAAAAAAYCKTLLYKVPGQTNEDTKALPRLSKTVDQLSNQIK
ncbi:purine and uridine phosphorylase [Aspergillus affinis]|uniref:purine and uridine phosphorylase n=1 Tax=Aspergillus affinis TaxID=1070780 RepID=UPI0022FEFCA2|nr:purine and uridine phosphorylase [Aspergillus affinis]KAI9036457.1 purine and uridine phosphorylase [Aspergillus affinis]